MANPLQVLVPDIGGFKDVSVIDVLVKDGQQIDKETPMITLETEKAAMDVPSPAAGRVAQVKLKKGDKVSEGSLILLLESGGEAQGVGAAAEPAEGAKPAIEAKPAGDGKPAGEAKPAGDAKASSDGKAAGAAKAAAAKSAADPKQGDAAKGTEGAPPTGKGGSAVSPAGDTTSADAATAARSSPAPAVDEAAFSKAYASPSVRKFARELGADLGKISGSGPKSRITQDDVKAYVKNLLSAGAVTGAGAGAAGASLPKVPEVDFAKFGAVEVQPLSRIQRISGARLQASWINLPHVTQHDDADITDMEIARVALKGKAEQEGVRLTPLAFIVKACVAALKEFPRFNASLDASGQNIVFKKYFNIGFAADTPNGLVVPVIRDADRGNLFDIARALAAMSEKARAGKLTAAEMQGGSFTISSLGGIGGTAFTPIINAPEVAILGVSKSTHKPVFDKGTFIPRLMLPLSLSYDHRVIDGAQAARFVVFLSKTLGDVKALL
ncbi:MAG TPA: 2-oxo acid dehydrogenase subunit E2 [Steroidobacteraceae bacterium]|nr:2-oxo acid dehydrogenase subunit E2 [Steroidobacteraceae bacterium]